MHAYDRIVAARAVPSLLAQPAAHAQKRTYINPIDIDYRYNWEQTNSGVSYRTGADPAIVRHKGAYYLFQTLADGYWRSTDLIDWTFITPSRWPFDGIVAPAAISDGDRLILWPSMSFTRPGSILVSTAPETGKLDFLVRRDAARFPARSTTGSGGDEAGRGAAGPVGSGPVQGR